MSFKKVHIIFLTSFLVIGYWYFVLIFPLFEIKSFKVHFLNVGQGDSILLETPRGSQILIDGGRGVSVLSELAKVIPVHDKKIDIVIATHPDADHIGGLIPVFDQFEIGKILLPRTESNTSVYSNLSERIVKEESQVIYVESSSVFVIDGVTFYLLWPSASISDTNASSIVLVASYGETQVFLSGDAPTFVEELLVETFPEILTDIEIFKAGHHGSDTSSSESLLELSNPDYFVISAGENNSFGHPTKDVLDRARGQILQTKDGTISFYIYGDEIYLEQGRK